MIKVVFEQNIDKNTKINSYPVIFDYSTKSQRNRVLKPIVKDVFEKNTINFKGSIDESSNPTNPIRIASLEKRKEIKKNLIQALEQKKFIEGSLITYYQGGFLTKHDVLEIATSQAGRIPVADRGFFIENKIPLTLADDEGVLTQRLHDFKTPQLDIYDTSYLKQKSRIIKIGAKDMEKIPKNKKLMLLLTGLPASGKTSLVDKKMQKKYYLADPDEYLKYFLEYQNGKGSTVLQNVARDLLRNHLFPMALDKGINITLSTIGWVEYVEGIVKEAKAKGYTIELKHVNIDTEKSIKRTVNRFKETGRLVDPYWINAYSNTLNDKFGIRIENLPEYFKQSPYIDKISIYDNNKDYFEETSLLNKVFKRMGLKKNRKKPEYVKTIKNEIFSKKINFALEKFKKIMYNNVRI